MVKKTGKPAKKLVSKSEFARRCLTSAAAITKICNTKLKNATEGKRINLSHPDAAEYLRKKIAKAELKASQQEPEPPGVPESTQEKIPHIRGYTAKKESRKRNSGPVDTESLPEDLREFIDWTLGDLVKQFGTDIMFLDWLNATEKIENIRAKRLKNEALEKTLITRSIVDLVVDVFNSTNLRMMKDGPKTLTATVVSGHKSGSNEAEIAEKVLGVISSFIRPAKAKAVRILKNA